MKKKTQLVVQTQLHNYLLLNYIAIKQSYFILLYGAFNITSLSYF